MTSEEIRKVKMELPQDERAFFLQEIAYQLAVMNEREAAKAFPTKEIPRPGAALAYCKCASVEGDNPACPIHCATMRVTP